MEKGNKYLYEFKINEDSYQILKPTRKLKEESELYQYKCISDLVRAGVLPLAAWTSKVYGNTEVKTDEKHQEIGQIIEDIRVTSEKLNKLKILPEEDRAADYDEDVLKLETNLAIAEQSYQTYQQIKSQEFDSTAEGIARQKNLIWLTAFLSYKNNEPIFAGKTIDEKLDFAETIEDQNLIDGIARLKVLIMAWFNNRANDEESFAKIDKEICSLLESTKEPIKEGVDNSKIEE